MVFHCPVVHIIDYVVVRQGKYLKNRRFSADSIFHELSVLVLFMTSNENKFDLNI